VTVWLPPRRQQHERRLSNKKSHLFAGADELLLQLFLARTCEQRDLANAAAARLSGGQIVRPGGISVAFNAKFGRRLDGKAAQAGAPLQNCGAQLLAAIGDNIPEPRRHLNRKSDWAHNCGAEGCGLRFDRRET